MGALDLVQLVHLRAGAEARGRVKWRRRLVLERVAGSLLRCGLALAAWRGSLEAEAAYRHP